MLRTFADCKTKAAFLAALGITEGPDLDEVGKILQTAHGAGAHAKRNVQEILFSLLATLVGLGITPDPVDEKTMWKNCAITAQQVIETFPLKESTRTGIFAHTPGNTWPDGFLEFVTTRANVDPSDKWCKDNGLNDASNDLKKLAFYGSKLLTTFKDTKQFINNHLNPIWAMLPDKIPSGVTQSTLVNWVRQQVWPVEAEVLARAWVYQDVTRRNKAAGITTKFNMNDHMTLLHDNIASRMFSDSWFPQCWLSFICFGQPSGDCRPCFMSGSVALAKNIQSLGAIRELGGLARQARRQIDGLVDADLTTPKRQKMNSPAEPGVVKQVNVNHNFTNTLDKYNVAKARYDLLKEIGSPEEIENAKRALLAEMDAIAPPK